jgi:hypothetical protein
VIFVPNVTRACGRRKGITGLDVCQEGSRPIIHSVRPRARVTIGTEYQRQKNLVGTHARRSRHGSGLRIGTVRARGTGRARAAAAANEHD